MLIHKDIIFADVLQVNPSTIRHDRMVFGAHKLTTQGQDFGLRVGHSLRQDSARAVGRVHQVIDAQSLNWRQPVWCRNHRSSNKAEVVMDALRREHQKLVHERVPVFFAVQDDSPMLEPTLQ